MKLLELVSAFLLLTAQDASAQPEAVLKRAGALQREASAGDTSRTEKVTDLKCVLRLRHSDKTYAVSGTLYDSGLYVVEGGIRVFWSVLPPTDNLEPTALAGDYDITSKFGFKYAHQRSDVLVGGMNDSVALELVTPTVDAINPSVRLTLVMSEAENKKRS